MTELRDERTQLIRQEYEEVLDDLKPLINKCFVKKVYTQDNNIISHYCCITGYPELEVTRTSVTFNPFQLPAIHFYTTAHGCYPFSMNDDRQTFDVFFFDMVNTKELPRQYSTSLRFPDVDRWTEVTRDEFSDAAERRYRQFIQKIFEPTTYPW